MRPRTLPIDCGVSRRAVKMLGELPAAILDVVVQSAGEEHGWRLEVASPVLRATSMECCAIRLGKCRWMGGNRGMAEFAPSWRHVAVALRRGPYYVLRAGIFHRTHMRFPLGGEIAAGRRGMTQAMSGVSRREADKFTIKPTRDGEGIIHTSIYNAHVSYKYRDANNDTCMNLVQDERLPLRPTPWLLHLGSHASHLPFRRCRMHGDGRICRVLKGWNKHAPGGTPFHVNHWELAPATLTDDERFEWRV